MTNFNNYLEFSNSDEDKEKQLKIFNKINFSNDSIEKLISIDHPISLLIFAESYCPDCRAIIPLFEKSSIINNNISIEYLSRENNFETLVRLNKEAKIPTVFYHNNESLNIFISEFPNCVKMLMNDNKDSYDDIKYNFRTGKYNSQIEEEIVNFLISI